MLQTHKPHPNLFSQACNTSSGRELEFSHLVSSPSAAVHARLHLFSFSVGTFLKVGQFICGQKGEATRSRAHAQTADRPGWNLLLHLDLITFGRKSFAFIEGKIGDVSAFDFSDMFESHQQLSNSKCVTVGLGGGSEACLRGGNFIPRS